MIVSVKEKEDVTSIYDKKGEVVSEESYNGLNKHFNDLIKKVLDKPQNINDWQYIFCQDVAEKGMVYLSFTLGIPEVRI